jgi:hypothetical protein
VRDDDDADDAMRRWGWLVLALAGAACASAGHDQAVFQCRQAGYLGAVEDAGTWYCWRDRLGVPQIVPAKP